MTKWGFNYCLAVDDDGHLLDLAPRVFDLVWRVDFTAPGFAVVDLPSGLGSRDLRFWMVDLKHRLNEISVIRGRAPLAYKSMGRFNQQETTKFHLKRLDAAPARRCRPDPSSEGCRRPLDRAREERPKGFFTRRLGTRGNH